MEQEIKRIIQDVLVGRLDSPRIVELKKFDNNYAVLKSRALLTIELKPNIVVTLDVTDKIL